MSHVWEPRVRETSSTTSTTDFVLAGAVRGSLRFASVMSVGDTCDYTASYDNTFEEGTGTLTNVGGSPDVYTLQRTTVTRALHANGTVDTNKVSFAAGVKTIIMVFRANRLRVLPRGDEAQTLTVGEQAQIRANAPPFASGTRMMFQQTSAPTGWTKDVSHDNKALRVVSGAVSSGGTVDFSTAFARTGTDPVTLARNNLPNVDFMTDGAGKLPLVNETNVDFGTALGNQGAGGGINGVASTGQPTIGGHIYLNSNVTQQSFTPAIDLRIKYVDLIFASKD